MESIFANSGTDKLRAPVSTDNIVALGASPSTLNAILAAQDALRKDLAAGGEAALRGAQTEGVNTSTVGQQLQNTFAAETIKPRVGASNAASVAAQSASENARLGTEAIRPFVAPTAVNIGATGVSTTGTERTLADVKRKGAEVFSKKEAAPDVISDSLMSEAEGPTRKALQEEKNLEATKANTESVRIANERNKVVADFNKKALAAPVNDYLAKNGFTADQLPEVVSKWGPVLMHTRDTAFADAKAQGMDDKAADSAATSAAMEELDRLQRLGLMAGIASRQGGPATRQLSVDQQRLATVPNQDIEAVEAALAGFDERGGATDPNILERLTGALGDPRLAAALGNIDPKATAEIGALAKGGSLEKATDRASRVAALAGRLRGQLNQAYEAKTHSILSTVGDSLSADPMTAPFAKNAMADASGALNTFSATPGLDGKTRLAVASDIANVYRAAWSGGQKNHDANLRNALAETLRGPNYIQGGKPTPLGIALYQSVVK